MDVPTGWARLGGRGLGPFVTREVLRRPDGTLVTWESRWHRKHPVLPSGSTWWAPRALAWWIGVLFAVGSICFALGSFPPYATAVGTTPDNLTYFIGSIFFTTASFLQYYEVASTPTSLDDPHRQGSSVAVQGPAPPDRLVGRRSSSSSAPCGSTGRRSAPWWSAWARRPTTTRSGARTRLGSICFLVSSWFAWAEECHGRFAWRPSLIPWWITFLNLVGSVAFGVSAIASYVEPNGQLVSLALTNLGTFVGAICFLVGALLLLPSGRSKALRLSPSPRPLVGTAT